MYFARAGVLTAEIKKSIFSLEREESQVTVINTNVSATLASNAIARNERAMGTAMERLSTGKRINFCS